MEQIKLPRCMTQAEFIVTDNDTMLYSVRTKDLTIFNDEARNLNSASLRESEYYSGLFVKADHAYTFSELYESNSIVFDTKRNTWILRDNLISVGEGLHSETDPLQIDEKASILLEAFNIVNGSRNSDYKGTEGFEKISEIWNKLYPNKPLTAYDISMVMVVLKLVRESITPKKDNLVDACGYLHFANQLTNK